MHNANRLPIFGIFLLGTLVSGFIATQYVESDSQSSMKGAVVFGMLSIASAVIAAGALSGMSPPQPKYMPPPPQAQPSAQMPYPQQAYGQYGAQPQPGQPQPGQPPYPGQPQPGQPQPGQPPYPGQH